MSTTHRIGPQMRRAINYVAAHPGCSKVEVARHVLPYAVGYNNAYAYGPIDRAIKAGLIVAGRGRGNAYSLDLPIMTCEEDPETILDRAAQETRRLVLAALHAAQATSLLLGRADRGSSSQELADLADASLAKSRTDAALWAVRSEVERLAAKPSQEILRRLDMARWAAQCADRRLRGMHRRYSSDHQPDRVSSELLRRMACARQEADLLVESLRMPPARDHLDMQQARAYAATHPLTPTTNL